MRHKLTLLSSTIVFLYRPIISLCISCVLLNVWPFSMQKICHIWEHLYMLYINQKVSFPKQYFLPCPTFKNIKLLKLYIHTKKIKILPNQQNISSLCGIVSLTRVSMRWCAVVLEKNAGVYNQFISIYSKICVMITFDKRKRKN